jgi:hypothetical protein
MNRPETLADGSLSGHDLPAGIDWLMTFRHRPDKIVSSV